MNAANQSAALAELYTAPTQPAKLLSAPTYRLGTWCELRDDGELLIDLIDAEGHEHGLSLEVAYDDERSPSSCDKLELFAVVGAPYEGKPTEAQARQWLRANRAAAESAALDAHAKRARRWRSL